MDSADFGELSFGIPDDFPNRDVFRDVLKGELNYFFAADLARAAYCASEYARCQQGPLPFFENWEAAVHYRAAQMSVSPAAQQWAKFERSVYERFFDYCIEGGKEHVIPGWRLEKLSVAVRPKVQQQAAAQGPRLDQTKSAEARQGKGRTRSLSR